MELILADRGPGIVIDVRHAERGGERLRRIDRAGRFVAEAGLMAHIGITRGIDHHRCADAAQSVLRRHNEFFNAPISNDDILHESVEQHRRTRLNHEAVPHDLEMLGQIGDARPRTVRVRPFDDGSDATQTGHDIVTDPTNDLACPITGRVEAVERVEDGRRVPPEERELLDEEGANVGPGGGDGRGRSRGPRPDHDNVKSSVLVDAHVLRGPANRILSGRRVQARLVPARTPA